MLGATGHITHLGVFVCSVSEGAANIFLTLEQTDVDGVQLLEVLTGRDQILQSHQPRRPGADDGNLHCAGWAAMPNLREAECSVVDA
jgi:hypothetical protein